MIQTIIKEITESEEYYESEAYLKNFQVRFNEKKGLIELFLSETFLEDENMENGIMETSNHKTRLESFPNKTLKDYCNLIIDLQRLEIPVTGDFV